FVETRTRYAQMYNDAFAGIEELEVPPVRDDSRHAWHLYILRLNLHRLRIDRGEFINQLREMGVLASVHFIPIPMHPYFAALCLGGHTSTNAMDLYPRILSLPLYPAMSEEQVHQVASAVAKAVEGARKKTWVVSTCRALWDHKYGRVTPAQPAE